MTASRPHSPERLIFEACLDLDPAERSSFIDEKCRNDAELAERVRRLLEAHERAQADSRVIDPTGIPELLDPKQIGPYRILRPLGEGGMGVVYLAEQTRPLRRRIALKIIKLGMDTKQVIARFDSERQALARMSHSNIARILDAGATEQGRPYFVMEYVEGQPLHHYCDDRRLVVDERLRLFVQVCGAIEHAHQRGVIHRDLKPGNIIVAEEQGQPVPKVIDFGIAKATDQRLTEHTVYTQMGEVIGTPEYMSPEQADRPFREVDLRTDIYSLGVLLYELLAGVLPFDFRRQHWSLAQKLEVIREVDPAAPSVRIGKLEGRDIDAIAEHRATTAPTLQRTLRGELDWITLKALEKDRLRRYPTASELASDVERFLRRETVSAGPLGAMFQVRRLIGRHRIAFATIGGVLALLVAAVLADVRSDGTGSADLPRLVVLPFQNIGSPEDEYFADGMMDEVTGRLARASGLVVIARRSAVGYKGSDKSPQQIGKELGADFILVATIGWQRTEDASRVRVRPQLIRAADASQVWAAAYDEDLTAVFDVQTRIAEKVAEAMSVVVVGPERESLAGRPTENLEAYDYYLRAIAILLAEGTNERTLHASAEMYEEAIERDPLFAAAYARLSVVHSLIYWFQYDRSDTRRATARQTAERALQLEPGLAYGHLALGRYYYHGFRDYQRAIDELLIADRLEPNNPDVLRAKAYVRRRQGDWDGATRALEQVLALDPRDDGALSNLVETHLLRRDYESADRYLNALHSLVPLRPPTLRYLLALLAGGTQQQLDSIVADYARTSDVTAFVVSAGLTSQALLARALDLTRFFGAVGSEALERTDSDDWGTLTEGYYLANGGYYAHRGASARARVYYDSARVILESRLRERPNNEESHILIAFAYAGLERWDEVRNAVSRALQLLPISRDAMEGAANEARVARLEVMLGEYDSAIDRLEYLLSIPSPLSAPLLRNDPAFDALRTHPRFQELLTKYQ